MNIYGTIILSILIIDFALNSIANFLNIKNISNEIPHEFLDTYDSEKYKKSQDYLRVKTKFSYISSFVSLVIMLTFWFIGGFNWLDLILLEFIDNPIWRGISYIFVLILANSILSLPFSIYSIFVIEERFGFNKTTPLTFVLDIIKSSLLGLIIGLPILCIVLLILQDYGANNWWLIWIVITLVSVLIRYIAPSLIMPIFNKFTPLQEGQLKNQILSLAKSTNFPLSGVFIIDGSKRSSKSNAFFTGFGKTKRIALYDTLVANHSNDELLAILAHEIGHYKKNHILQGMIISILHTGLILFLLSQFVSNDGLHKAFYMVNINYYSGLIFFGLLLSPIELIISIGSNILSRMNEFQADKFAKDSIDNHSSMVNALKKLSKDNLSNLTPHPFYVFLNYSHPPVLQRIEKIQKSPL